MTEEQRKKIGDLLQRNKIAVIATNALIVGVAPQSAAITFSETSDLYIIFGSSKGRRKNFNIALNPKVSLVVGWDRVEMKTIQIEGDVFEVTDEAEIEVLKELHYKKNPESEKYRNYPDRVYFKVIPFWIRYSHLSKDPQEVWEVKIAESRV